MRWVETCCLTRRFGYPSDLGKVLPWNFGDFVLVFRMCHVPIVVCSLASLGTSTILFPSPAPEQPTAYKPIKGNNADQRTGPNSNDIQQLPFQDDCNFHGD